MGKSKCEIRVGTSGWHYKHWRGVFYPEELKTSEWFGFFAKHFDTVEVNNSFYKLPDEKTVKDWAEEAPKGFLYTVKANRYITHIKKLSDPGDALDNFYERMGHLGKTMGPVLYQLPPNLHKKMEKLRAFCEMLPKGHNTVFEFRHASWYDDDVLDVLDEFGCGFCVHDMGGVESPKERTGDVIYLRFHGTQGEYSGGYTDGQLSEWADWVKKHKKGIKAVYAYFNNDVEGNAVRNAMTLRDMLM
ncbi:hypothetical protein STSP2_03505 [Anaerohalosphaera lusitana]|uniref:DUF72 domain-containing protein n=1 Tax=Anaerohalosphaera lusitana TaxID=1936003 RepID=A0A1U9NQW1_9BACT|nr:DUF72 domain-containing protein [Anaerohalosphaera lusitana]AQT70299.1 hypothetical protein STSP2_03505 [Anaerohalosphaera lusitana]